MDSRIARIFQNKKQVSCGTHDGKFHTDELVAIALILQCFGDKCAMNIIRTRDAEVLASCDIVLDVGYKNHGKYFDHHGRDFDETHPDTKFKLATTGIVWYDIKDILLDKLSLGNQPTDVREMALELIHKRIILPTDADDNGQFGARATGPQPMTLPEIVNSFNVSVTDNQYADQAFAECLSLIRIILDHKFLSVVRQATEQRRILSAMLNASPQDMQDGIFVLKEAGPWISVVLNNWEDTLPFKLCITPGNDDHSWRIQTFPGSRYDRRSMRCGAPVWMRGYQKNVNPLVENIDVIFVNKDGFIGAVEGTLEQAKEFARLWISQSEN